jgi:hypothetical protein
VQNIGNNKIDSICFIVHLFSSVIFYKKYNMVLENHVYASFTMFNGMAFSTFDRDMDSSSKQNCAKETDGAWWYDDCSGTSSQSSNLNSIYCIMGFRCELDGRAIDPSYTFHYRYTLLARSKLMVRRKSIKWKYCRFKEMNTNIRLSEIWKGIDKIFVFLLS